MSLIYVDLYIPRTHITGNEFYFFSQAAQTPHPLPNPPVMLLQWTAILSFFFSTVLVSGWHQFPPRPLDQTDSIASLKTNTYGSTQTVSPSPLQKKRKSLKWENS